MIFGAHRTQKPHCASTHRAQKPCCASTRCTLLQVHGPAATFVLLHAVVQGHQVADAIAEAGKSPVSMSSSTGGSQASGSFPNCGPVNVNPGRPEMTCCAPRPHCAPPDSSGAMSMAACMASQAAATVVDRFAKLASQNHCGHFCRVSSLSHVRGGIHRSNVQELMRCGGIHHARVTPPVLYPLVAEQTIQAALVSKFLVKWDLCQCWQLRGWVVGCRLLFLVPPPSELLLVIRIQNHTMPQCYQTPQASKQGRCCHAKSLRMSSEGGKHARSTLGHCSVSRLHVEGLRLVQDLRVSSSAGSSRARYR